MKRRNLIKKLWIICCTSVMSVPLISFILKNRFRPPLEIEINSNLKDGEYLIKKDFVLFYSKGRAFAISRKCTHLGCRVNFIDKNQGFICPCHQSRFDWRGRYVAGPAKKDLALYKVVKAESGQGYRVMVPR